MHTKFLPVLLVLLCVNAPIELSLHPHNLSIPMHCMSHNCMYGVATQVTCDLNLPLARRARP